MASLLGSKYCIESLRRDVSDLQSAVADVLSRVGPSASFRSWKYPDKLSTDVSIPDLLETHVYSEDDEERQIAHVVLLELVIDRCRVVCATMELPFLLTLTEWRFRITLFEILNLSIVKGSQLQWALSAFH